MIIAELYKELYIKKVHPTMAILTKYNEFEQKIAQTLSSNEDDIPMCAERESR